MSTAPENDDLAAQERALRRAYEIIADPDRSFRQQVDALLSVVQDAVGTDYATLSRVHYEADRYLFEAVAAPGDVDLEPGTTVPLVELPNCAHVVQTEQTLVLKDVAAEAPELDDPTWGISCYLGAPVVVDGETYGTFCFYDMEARSEDFSDWQVTFVELLSNWVSYELERQRYIDRLAALTELDRVVRELTDAVIDLSSREEVEAVACRTLAESDSYLFAWVGEADPATQAVRPRTEAGVEGLLDGVDVSVDPDRPGGDDPVGRTLRTGSPQTVQDLHVEAWSEAARERAEAYGYRSQAAVPIAHGGTVYGVLAVYAERAEAFQGHEASVVAHLGDVLGHAIASVERKRALTSDAVIELRFRIRDALARVNLPEVPDEPVVLDELVRVADDEFLLYGTTSESGVTTIAEVAEATPQWHEVTRIGERADSVAFKIRLSEPPFLTAIADSGGTLENMVIEGGDLRATVHLPPEVDVRRVVETISEVYPETSVVSKRQVSRPRPDLPSERAREALAADLTERQQLVLRTAYREGYFEWPRDASAEAVADSLDIASPTFHQHLRAAENKLLEVLLGEPGQPDEPDPA